MYTKKKVVVEAQVCVRVCLSLSVAIETIKTTNQKGLRGEGKGQLFCPPHLWTTRLFWRKKDRYQNVDLATVAEVAK